MSNLHDALRMLCHSYKTDDVNSSFSSILLEKFVFKLSIQVFLKQKQSICYNYVWIGTIIPNIRCKSNKQKQHFYAFVQTAKKQLKNLGSLNFMAKVEIVLVQF